MFFKNVEECKKANKIKNYTNPRYKEFNQTHFTAGDEDQFQEFISSTNNELFIPKIFSQMNKYADGQKLYLFLLKMMKIRIFK